MKQGSLVTVVPMWASKGWGEISSLFSWAQRASKWWMVTFGLTSLDPTYPLSNVLTHSFKSWKQLSIAENISINHLPSVKRGNTSSNHTPTIPAELGSQQPSIRNSGHFPKNLSCVPGTLNFLTTKQVWKESSRTRTECLWANPQNANLIFVALSSLFPSHWYSTESIRINRLFQSVLYILARADSEDLVCKGTPRLQPRSGHFKSRYTSILFVLSRCVSRHVPSSS